MGNQPTYYPSFQFSFSISSILHLFPTHDDIILPIFLIHLILLPIYYDDACPHAVFIVCSPSQQQDVMFSPSQQQDVMVSPSQQQDVMFSPSQQQDGSCRQGNKKGHMGEEEKKEE